MKFATDVARATAFAKAVTNVMNSGEVTEVVSSLLPM